MAADWRAFIEGLAIDARIPNIVRAKFTRAQTLYLLGWIDFSVLKAGELAALIALELALMDRYGGRVSKNKRSFAALLKFMVDSDGLTDAQIPMAVRCGGTAIGQLTGESRPTLSERRNALAHGDPFDGLPTGGLLELRCSADDGACLSRPIAWRDTAPTRPGVQSTCHRSIPEAWLRGAARNAPNRTRCRVVTRRVGPMQARARPARSF